MKLLSIIIPIYNEEAILEGEVGLLVEEMKKVLPSWHYNIFLIENGSFDQTRAITEELRTRHVGIVNAIFLPSAGYGQALKVGILQSTGDYIAMFNIDFWDVQFLNKAMNIIDEKSVDMVVGSKTMSGAEDSRPLVRRAITRSFNFFLKVLFGFQGTDTHGLKLAVKDKIEPIIRQCKTEREIFDTEFVLRSQQQGLRIAEVPVVCYEKRRTVYTISKRIPRTIKDLFILFFVMHFKKEN